MVLCHTKNGTLPYKEWHFGTLLRENLPLPELRAEAAIGVMMIPIPQPGIFRGVCGLDAARAVAGISDIQITASPGQLIAAPPEGASYLGFIFADGISSGAVESSLREAHALLQFDIQAAVPVSAAQT